MVAQQTSPELPVPCFQFIMRGQITLKMFSKMVAAFPFLGHAIGPTIADLWTRDVWKVFQPLVENCASTWWLRRLWPAWTATHQTCAPEEVPCGASVLQGDPGCVWTAGQHKNQASWGDFCSGTRWIKILNATWPWQRVAAPSLDINRGTATHRSNNLRNLQLLLRLGCCRWD